MDNINNGLPTEIASPVVVHVIQRDGKMRAHLARLLQKHDFIVTKCRKSCNTLDLCNSEPFPDVLVIDVRTAYKNCIPKKAFKDSDSTIVITAPHPNASDLATVIAAGADAYTNQNDDQKIISAIRTTLKNAHAVEKGALRDLCTAATNLHKHNLESHVVDLFTPAEIRILNLLAAGFDNQTITKMLNVSINTIKTHLRHIFRKLGCSDRTQAALWAARHLHFTANN